MAKGAIAQTTQSSAAEGAQGTLDIWHRSSSFEQMS
jgi:hypothetical protein